MKPGDLVVQKVLDNITLTCYNKTFKNRRL